MRSTLKCLAVMLVVAVGTTAWAQDDEKPEGREGRRRGPNLAEAIKKMELPAETEEKVLGLLKTHHEAVEAWRKEHEEEFKAHREAVKAAKEAGDEDKLAELRKQGEALMAGRKELHEQLMTQLDEVLDDEQMAKVKKLFERRKGHGQRGPGFLRGLDLTEEQKAQVKTIMDEAKKKAEAADTPEAKKEIMQAAHKKVFDEVLTEEQQAKAKERREAAKKRREAGGSEE